VIGRKRPTPLILFEIELSPVFELLGRILQPDVDHPQVDHSGIDGPVAEPRLHLIESHALLEQSHGAGMLQVWKWQSSRLMPAAAP
jgi:hypothetical protein